MEQGRTRKIRETDPRLREQESLSHSLAEDDSVKSFVSEFAEVLSASKYHESEAMRAMLRLDTRIKRHFESAKKQLQDDIRNGAYSGDREAYYSHFIELACQQDPDIVRVLLERNILPYMPGGDAEPAYYLNDNTSPDYVYQIYEALEDGLLEDSDLKRIFAAYQEGIELVQERFEEKLPEYTREFLSDVRKGYGEGWFPVSPEEVENRMTYVRTMLGDASVTTFDDMYGNYSAELRKVSIAADVFSARSGEKQLKDTMWHEWLHAISGRTVYITEHSYASESDDEDDDEEGWVKDETARLGLRISGISPEDTWQRFIWLNEAVTEYVARQLRQGRETPQKQKREDAEAQLHLVIGGEQLFDEGAYVREQKLVQALVDGSEGHVTWKMLRDAYFERFDADAEGSATHFRVLSAALRAAYGDGALVRIDKELKENTYKDTLQTLAEHAKRGTLAKWLHRS